MGQRASTVVSQTDGAVSHGASAIAAALPPDELDPEEPGISDAEKAARMHVLEPADRGRVWTDYFAPVEERALGKGAAVFGLNSSPWFYGL